MRGRLDLLDKSGSPTSPIRVVLADNHPAMRRTLRRLLDNDQGIEVVGEACDLDSAESQVHQCRPAVLVIDMRLRAAGSRTKKIEQLRERAPGTQIVLITMSMNQLLAEQMLLAGAIGFVLKDSADAELGEAVHRAAQSVQYTSPRLQR